MKSQEAKIQSALIQRAKLYEHVRPELRWLHAIPNGGSRNKIEAVNLKRQGVKAGVLDLFFPVARRGFHGFYLEIKYGKNKLTPTQREFTEFAVSEGYLARTYWDVDSAWNDLVWYLKT